MHLLIVEDDLEIASFLIKGLTEAGHRVEHADNGRDGLLLATREHFDAIVLDRLMPQMDGLAVLEALRSNGSSVPVMILSALNHVDERIKGLRAGGDDYLVKPFVLSELLARLDVITRRNQRTEPDNCLRVHTLELNRLTRQVVRDGEEILLKPQEYRVLEYLMRHNAQIVTRTMLLEGVWDYHFDPQTNVIDVHMSRLRNKIDKAPWPVLIHTLRGAGYCLREPD